MIVMLFLSFNHPRYFLVNGLQLVQHSQTRCLSLSLFHLVRYELGFRRSFLLCCCCYCCCGWCLALQQLRFLFCCCSCCYLCFLLFYCYDQNLGTNSGDSKVAHEFLSFVPFDTIFLVMHTPLTLEDSLVYTENSDSCARLVLSRLLFGERRSCACVFVVVLAAAPSSLLFSKIKYKNST